MSTKGNSLLVGTSKGLVVCDQENGVWHISTAHFVGMPVSMIYVDERSDTWWVCLSHRHWGSKLHRSKNRGKDWEEVTMPFYPKGAEIKAGTPAELKKIWCMAHCGLDRPRELWLGTEPGALFHSRDNGDHFELVEGLWNHPSRMDQNQWFGAGRDHPFLHSIVVDPRNSQHLYIAVSCAGVFESWDGGKNWEARNRGLIAAYLPNPRVEIGHDPHRLLTCAADPDVLWQQNHCGIFRSTNGGKEWKNVTDPNGIANYGFALSIDDNDPLKAWVIPATSDEIRVAPELALCVCNTEDGGKSWTPHRQGLPQGFAFDLVFRHSMVFNGKTLAFGTTNGNLYFSDHKGEAWECLSNHLARIDYLAFA